MIDIVGLQISTAEFLWTIISFFLFTFLLKKILYDPILKVMDARNARIKAGLDEGRNAQKALEDSKAQFSAELAGKSGEARELISASKAAAEKEKGEALGIAHAEAEKVHKEVRQKVADEEKAAQDDLCENMPELVAILTGRLLGGDVSDELVRSCVEASED